MTEFTPHENELPIRQSHPLNPSTNVNPDRPANARKLPLIFLRFAIRWVWL